MATAGKLAIISVATTIGGVYSVVGEISEASCSISADNLDVTIFSLQWIRRIQGLKDMSWSLSGFQDSTDTTGQVVIRDSLINDTPVFIKFTPILAGTVFTQEGKVSSFEVSAAVDGAVELSIEFEGTGTPTIV